MTIINNRNIKELTWKVVSNKMDKTIVVSVERIKIHRIYKKRYSVSKKFYVHDEKNTAKIWDVVKFRQSKPISKLKKWKMIDIINK